MQVAATDYLEAIARLPDDANLTFDGVAWQDYERLLADLGPGYSVRIFYDEGRMEITAPTPAHERAKNMLIALVYALRDELDVDIESLGSTTFRSKAKAKGFEPDGCFYVEHFAAALRMEDEFNPQRDPPPDIVVEVDRARTSLDKFPIFAALGVPEIWRVFKKEVRFYVLNGDSYAEVLTSRAFSFLESSVLSEFIVRGLAEGGREATRAFRTWVRENRTRMTLSDE
jgi:Uma2 family endonuclease